MSLILNKFPQQKENIIDSYTRTFETIRLSLTSICNFSCIYCNIDLYRSKKNFKEPYFYISIIEELKKFINIKKIHLTGGEPSIYPYLKEIIKNLKNLSIPHVSITTNGSFLMKKIGDLKEARLDSINLSLDAKEDSILRRMGTMKSFSFYDKLIDLILNYKICLKINTLILKNYNENQILPLLEYCGTKHITVRFLEYMQMGVTKDIHKKRFFSQKEILEIVQQRYRIQMLEREKNSTTNYWITDTGFVFGIIANYSNPFCFDCNRLRIDSEGRIYGCITQQKGYNFDEKNLCSLLKLALQNKQRYFKGSILKMIDIGG